MMRCLYWYKKLEDEGADYHPACSRKLFGQPVPPILPYTEEQMLPLAQYVIKSQVQ